MNDSSSDNKEQRILESALRLFVDRGFHGTSTNAISKEAGVSAGILFHYFSTKKTLIVYLFLMVKTEFYEMIFKALDNSSLENSLRSFWNCSIKWAFENMYKFRFMTLYNSSPFYNEVRNNELIQDYDRVLTEVFQKGIETGFFKHANIDLLKNNAFNLIVSFINTASEQEDSLDQLLVEGWDCFSSCFIK